MPNDRLPPIPPGQILREEFMKPIGLSARQLARELNIPPNRVTAILNGTRSVTAATAIMLGKRFGTTPEFWMGLQTAHDLEVAGHQRAYHPSELPEHLKAAVQTARMDPKHDHLNALTLHELRERRAKAAGQKAMDRYGTALRILKDAEENE